ncbi:MAG: hypothetical protein KDE27_01785, partial [Planctomycetes bacterium]|nr:hypothetical protein [Planctomycetota bacterium]
MRSRHSLPCSLILVATAGGFAHAQGDYETRHWTNANGLPQTTVSALAQDAFGYLWIGTLGGLARFDGARIEVFDRTKPPFGWPTRIRDLACAPDGSLWIASEDRGLLRVGDERITMARAGETLAVDFFAEGRGIALVGGAVCWLDASGRHCLPDSSFPGGKPSRLTIVRDTAVVSADDGAFVHRGERWQRIEFSAIPAGERVRDLDHDADGTVWFRFERRLARLPPGSTSATCLGELPGPGATLVRDGHGATWLDVGGRFARTTTADARGLEFVGELGDDEARTSLIDHEGNAWIGGNNGLAAAVATGLHVYEASDLGTSALGPVLPAAGGGVLVGTHDGIMRLEADEFRTLHATDGIVRALARAPDGSLWASKGDGLVHFADGGVERLQPSGSREILEMLRALWIDADGTVWAGGTRGLFRIGRETTHWTSDDGLADTDVLCIVRAPSGTLWIGTTAGACRMRGDRFETVALDGSEPVSQVRAILTASDGCVWFATYGRGLCAWHPDRIRWFTTTDGLPDNHLSAIALLAGGELAVTTNRGLAVSPYAALLGPTDRSAAPWATVAASPGRAIVEAQGGHQPPACTTPDGKLWFAVVGGLARYAPIDGAPETQPTPHIEELRGTDGNTLRAAELPIGVRDITVSYTAPSFTAPNLLRFCYRLAPLDQEWVDAGTARSATFRHLPPGRYSLQVMARVPGRRGEPQVDAIGFVVPEYWFERTAIRVAALALLAIAVFLGLRWRALKLRRHARELAELVRLRTAELRDEVEVRRRAEDSLRQHRDRLDEEVQARTADLRAACERLEHETSERVRLQGELLHTQKMDSLGLLAGGIAHDFNNLLTVINGTAELGGRSVDDRTSTTAAFDAIRHAGKTAAELTRQLMIFARRHRIEPAIQTVESVIADSRALIETSIGSGVDLHIRLDDEAWPVLLPRGHIEQILLNTCINARDAMSDVGSLTITTRRVTLDASAAEPHVGAGDYVELEVRDTGRGMNEDTIQRALDPFFTTKR